MSGHSLASRGTEKYVFSVESGLRAMSRLNENERIRAIGMIQAGVLHCAVAT